MQRYSVKINGQCAMLADDNGDWVRYDDAKRLRWKLSYAVMIVIALSSATVYALGHDKAMDKVDAEYNRGFQAGRVDYHQDMIIETMETKRESK